MAAALDPAAHLDPPSLRRRAWVEMYLALGQKVAVEVLLGGRESGSFRRGAGRMARRVVRAGVGGALSVVLLVLHPKAEHQAQERNQEQDQGRHPEPAPRG